jgi:hypothetical protein
MPCWQFSATHSTCNANFRNLKFFRADHFIIFLRYGGIYERGSREYTLDDFYALQLDKMEKYLCLKESDVVIPDGDVESSSDDDDDDDDSDDDSDEDDEDEEKQEADGRDAENEQDEADEEDTAQIAAESREEDQPTAEIEKQANLIDEESKRSQVNTFSSINTLDVKPSSLQNELRSQAAAFMGVSKDTTRSPEDIQSTPLPGETLAMFYARSR